MSDTTAPPDPVFVTTVPEDLSAQIEQILQRKESARAELQGAMDEVRNLRDEDGPLVQFPSNFEEMVQSLAHPLPTQVEKEKNEQEEKLRIELEKMQKYDEILAAKEKKTVKKPSTADSAATDRSSSQMSSAPRDDSNISVLSSVSVRSKLSVEEEERVDQLMNEDDFDELNSSVFMPAGVDADLIRDIDEKLKDLMEPKDYEKMVETERTNRSILSAASTRTEQSQSQTRDYLSEQRQERERREQLRVLDNIDAALVKLHTDSTPVSSEAVQELIRQCQAEQGRISSALASADVSFALDMSAISHHD